MKRDPIPVLMLSYNRMEYTGKALEAMRDSGHPYALTIWDNSSDLKTQSWLTGLDRKRYCIDSIVIRPSNEGIAPAMNWFFRKHHDYEYVAKLDNDSVCPSGWLYHLREAMLLMEYGNVGAISGTCLRPDGDTFADWVRKHMVTRPFRGGLLHYNSYVLGTGVLINMRMIRERGLLFEGFPCKISGWTDYTRVASEIEQSWRFAFYSKVPVTLLNLKAEHVLSGDYPEYDAELRKVRDDGNAWWASVGGLPGVKKFIDDHGGLKPLTPLDKPPYWHIDAINYTSAIQRFPPPLVPKRYLTECANHAERSTQQWWESRVETVGAMRSTFLDQNPARTQEFTAIHEEILRGAVSGKDVLEAGSGWGRASFFIERHAKSYAGVDFVQALVDKAKESLPALDFRQADARRLPFPDEHFDVVVAIACLSSFDEIFEEVRREFKRVLRPDGRILFLEEEWARTEWKMANK